MDTSLVIAIIALVSSIITAVLAFVLGRIRYRHDIRYSKAHEKRMDILESIYRTIRNAQEVCLDWAGSGCLADETTMKAAARRFDEVFAALTSKFYLNRIYIEESICEEIENFRTAAMGLFIPMSRLQRLAPFYHKREDHAIRYDATVQQLDAVIRNIGNVLTSVEVRFRRVLGIDNIVFIKCRQFRRWCISKGKAIDLEDETGVKP